MKMLDKKETACFLDETQKTSGFIKLFWKKTIVKNTKEILPTYRNKTKTPIKHYKIFHIVTNIDI
jgi:hypothetical protein